MSPRAVLPFDIIALIVDIAIEAAMENDDINFLKRLNLVSHYFHQNCSKYRFATLEIHDTHPKPSRSLDTFVKLLENSPTPDVLKYKYVRCLTYKLDYVPYQGNPPNPDSSLILLHRLRTISCLTYLKISTFNWSFLKPSLASALLHLMHLPTINHIDLSNVRNFPLSSFTPSVNLHRLDIHNMSPYDKDNVFENFQSGMMPKLREFHTSSSDTMTSRLFHARGQDGRPAFNFRDLRGLSMPFTDSEEDKSNIRSFLQNAKLLERLHLYIRDRSLVELHDIFSSTAHTLKVLDFTVSLYDRQIQVFLGGICEELEALAGHNMLEALSFKVLVLVDSSDTENFIGSTIQEVEKVLVKPGWSALRRVSFEVSCSTRNSLRWVDRASWSKLQQFLDSLLDKYLSHLSKLDFVAFNYSAEVAW